MQVVGLEPTRGCPRKILSLVRLPFRHIRIRVVHTTKLIITINVQYVNPFF